MAGVSHIFAGDDVPILTPPDRGAVAGVAEQDRADGAIGAPNAQHGHIPIHRPIGVIAEHHVVAPIDAPIHGEAGAALPILENRRLAVVQGRLHQLEQPGLQKPAVAFDALAFLRLGLHHIREGLVQHRRRMGVAGDDRDFAASQMQLRGQFLQDRLHEGAAHLQVIQRHQDETLARGVLQGQRLGLQRVIHFLRGLIPGAVSRQPDRQFRGDVPHGQPHGGRGILRRHPDCGQRHGQRQPAAPHPPKSAGEFHRRRGCLRLRQRGAVGLNLADGLEDIVHGAAIGQQHGLHEGHRRFANLFVAL
ncbi:MAG: hypothetical protein BWX68_02983 [Verrucomicrobia bacterium ADurb.Bin063]|nr:MAG: hypothetical protein BWX68_02983 [Verrucomicrobia bacterium ADurb.Bin063]